MTITQEPDQQRRGDGDDLALPGFVDPETWACRPGPHIEEVSVEELVPGASVAISGYGFGTHPTWVSVAFDTIVVAVEELVTGCITVPVPRAVCDATELRVGVNDLWSDPVVLPVTPVLEVAEGAVQVLGTAWPCLVEVETMSDLVAPSTTIVETACIGGGNYAPVPLLGVDPSFVTHRLTLVAVGSVHGAVPNNLAFGFPLLAAIVPIQTVLRKEKDAAGKDADVEYFWRDGKWWKIRDRTKKHPDDPELIDLRDDQPDKNFTEADPAVAAKLDAKFFPTGWQDFWEGFSDKSREQLQIMYIMLTTMQGIDAEDADLVLQIRKMLAEGKTKDEIYEAKASKINKALVGVAVGAALGGTAGIVLKKTPLGGMLRRFLKRFFDEDKLFKKVTRKRERSDGIDIDVDPSSPMGRQGKVKGDLQGRVDGDRLDVDSSTGNFENNTGQDGFVSELGQYWLKLLVDFARRKGLRKVRVRQWACTPKGARAARRNGMTPVPGRTKPDGTGQYEMEIPVPAAD